ncbi:MAG: hypothetical protein HYX66_09565 [Ignavibacteria bacterium]|nr:hypothetical protein [Ignavibacteria bacterium]
MVSMVSKWTAIACVALLVFVLSSCSSAPSQQIPPPQQQSVVIQSDILSPVAGMATEDTISLGPSTGPVTLKDGQAVRMELVGFDPSKHRITTTLGDSPNTVKLEIVGIDDGVVILKEKCQVVNIYGVGEVPRVRLPADISTEQLVITPIVNDDCEIYGYQVRYGSEERGCKSAAKEVLRRFQKCFSKPVSAKRINTKTIDMDCILFGDCK